MRIQRSVCLPRPSYVVPFWVVYYNPLPKNYNRPKKELHRSPWVAYRMTVISGADVQTPFQRHKRLDGPPKTIAVEDVLWGSRKGRKEE